jgi:hypothetical protein
MMGAPYLPGFGRCGIPRASPLTLPGATAYRLPHEPRRDQILFRFLEITHLDREITRGRKPFPPS